MLRDELPSEVLAGASLSGNEYGWSIETFPSALQKGCDLGYGCLGLVSTGVVYQIPVT